MAYYSPNINNFTATKQPAGSLDAAKKKAAIAKAYSSRSADLQKLAASPQYKASGLTESQYKQLNPSPGPSGGGSSSGGSSSGGSSSGDYYSKYMQMRQAGIMSEYEANASTIKQNLARAMADLDYEQASLAPVYQNSLSAIHANQFQSGEQMKEMMNQAGWTGQNSGLAIGEQGKIKIGADNARAEAKNTYDQGLIDVNRRKTLAKDIAGEEQKSLEKWKNAQLSGAEAEAWLANDERIQSAVKASRDYSADLAATALKQKQDYQATLDKAAAKQAESTSVRMKRANMAEIAAAVAKKDMPTLLMIQQAMAQDNDLLPDDFDAAFKYVTDEINKLDALGYGANEDKPAAAKGSTSFNLGG